MNSPFPSFYEHFCKEGEKLDFDKVSDSGAREEMETGSQRDTRKGKGRFDLIPAYAIERIAKHYENGAEKYGNNNWVKGQKLSRYMDSTLRHINKWMQGCDEEDHLAAAAWNLISIICTQFWIKAGLCDPSLDDRFEVFPPSNPEHMYEFQKRNNMPHTQISAHNTKKEL